ncbi:hypothetical protein HDU83_000310 [Entophlyctis luteolus]|nr:hypothetical protein HDU83_000310 [Entophlyctis luteolus]
MSNKGGDILLVSERTLSGATAVGNKQNQASRVAQSATLQEEKAASMDGFFGNVSNFSKMPVSDWWESTAYFNSEKERTYVNWITEMEHDSEIKNLLIRGDHGAAKPCKVLDLSNQAHAASNLKKAYPNLECFVHCESRAVAETYEEKKYPLIITVGDNSEIPYPEASFDLIMMLANSIALYKDPDSVLRDANRVLAPGGRIFIIASHYEFSREHTLPGRRWDWIDQFAFVCHEKKLDVKGLVSDKFFQEWVFSSAHLQEIFESAGFSILCDEKIFGTEDDDNQVLKLSTRKMVASKVTDTNPKAVEPDCAKNILSLAKPRMLHQDDLFESLVLILGDPSQPCVGKLNNTWNSEDFVTREKLVNALEELGYSTDSNLSVLDGHSTLHESLKRLPKNKGHFVFNLCDEGFDNEALKELHVPAILEMLRLPYSGAGPNCLAHCYDKGLVNRTADAIGVPTPKETFFFSNVRTPAVSNICQLDKVIRERINYPAFIKPIKGDNSLGITPRSIVHNLKELESYMHELNDIGIRDVVVQEYCQGTEYGVGMIGNLASGFHFFPVLEVDYSKIVARKLPPILGFESKWDPTSPYWSEISYKPALISDKVKSELHSWCIALWERFGCRDYARFDFRSDFGRGDGFEKAGERKGTIKLLEVNPNPGWCWDGKFAYMGKFENLDYKDVLGLILKAARDRTALEEEKHAGKVTQQEQ